jgi:RNA polymerase-binding transcription factor DksA
MPDALSTSDIERFRQQLVTLEHDLVRRLGREVDTGRDLIPDQAETGDIAVVDQLKDQYFQRAATDATTLGEVRAALGRIKDGRYGECVLGGEPIGRARLESEPWTPYCLKHQEEIEQRESAGRPTS